MSTANTSDPVQADRAATSSPRPLAAYAAIALTLGWVLLSAPLWGDQSEELMVLATLFIALVPPALLLTARDRGGAGVKALLRDAVRLPRPLRWAPVAALALPVTVWTAALALGGAKPLTVSLFVAFLIKLVTNALIINIWEELAWTGFFQRRAMARFGLLSGSLVTATLFAGIHLPMTLYGADDASDVLIDVAALMGTAVGLRLLIARVDTWSGRSLLTVGLLHASFNSTASLIESDSDWLRLAITVLIGTVAVLVGRSPVKRIKPCIDSSAKLEV